MPAIVITESGPERFDDIRPLWEQLNDHHIETSSHFSADFEQLSFEDRKKGLEAKAAQGKLRLFFAKSNDQIVGQCVASIMPEGLGEIDSIFVSPSCRGQRIGDALMQATLKWLDTNGAQKKTVVVIHGNDSANSFYARYGFQPRSTCLMQTDSA